MSPEYKGGNIFRLLEGERITSISGAKKLDGPQNVRVNLLEDEMIRVQSDSGVSVAIYGSSFSDFVNQVEKRT